MTIIICLEGITGAGKTAQAKMINDYLTERKSNYLIANEKQYSPFKEVVKNWLTEEQIKNFLNQTFLESILLVEKKLLWLKNSQKKKQ